MAKVRAVRTFLRFRGQQLILEGTSVRTLRDMADRAARIVLEPRSGKYYREVIGQPRACVDQRVVRTLARTRLIMPVPGEPVSYHLGNRGALLLGSLSRINVSRGT